jgi:hypothetical protein
VPIASSVLDLGSASSAGRPELERPRALGAARPRLESRGRLDPAVQTQISNGRSQSDLEYVTCLASHSSSELGPALELVVCSRTVLH